MYKYFSVKPHILRIPTKLIWYFSDFSTFSYAFPKFNWFKSSLNQKSSGIFTRGPYKFSNTRSSKYYAKAGTQLNPHSHALAATSGELGEVPVNYDVIEGNKGMSACVCSPGAKLVKAGAAVEACWRWTAWGWKVGGSGGELAVLSSFAAGCPRWQLGR